MNQHLMGELSNSIAFWLILILGLLFLYVLPSLIAAIRRVDGLGWIIVINLLPTGVGWLAAFVLAVALPGRRVRPARHDALGPASNRPQSSALFYGSPGRS
jgi:hypothetical protein